MKETTLENIFLKIFIFDRVIEAQSFNIFMGKSAT